MAFLLPIAGVVLGYKSISAIVGAISGSVQVNYVGDRYRSLEIVIVNGLKNSGLQFADEYYDSGCAYSHPTSFTAPGGATIGTVANKQGSFMCGVAGGMTFQITGTPYYLCIGFTHPAVGCIKSYIAVECRNDPSAGYKGCSDGSYKNLNNYGYTIQASLGESNVAHRRIIFFITDMTKGDANSILQRSQ